MCEHLSQIATKTFPVKDLQLEFLVHDQLL